MTGPERAFLSVYLAGLTGADADFADPIPTLVEAGEIAALLRY